MRCWARFYAALGTGEMGWANTESVCFFPCFWELLTNRAKAAKVLGLDLGAEAAWQLSSL